MGEAGDHAGRRTDAIIVGGGAGGALMALHLLRGAGFPIHVTLIETAPRIGRGIAYATANPSHLLNVPAGAMSAIDSEPNHFCDWLCERTGPPAASAAGTLRSMFVPRALYGEYLANALAPFAGTRRSGGPALDRSRRMRGDRREPCRRDRPPRRRRAVHRRVRGGGYRPRRGCPGRPLLRQSVDTAARCRRRAAPSGAAHRYRVDHGRLFALPRRCRTPRTNRRHLTARSTAACESGRHAAIHPGARSTVRDGNFHAIAVVAGARCRQRGAGRRLACGDRRHQAFQSENMEHPIGVRPAAIPPPRARLVERPPAPHGAGNRSPDCRRAAIRPFGRRCQRK